MSSTPRPRLQIFRWFDFLLHLSYFFHSFAWVHGKPLILKQSRELPYIQSVYFYYRLYEYRQSLESSVMLAMAVHENIHLRNEQRPKSHQLTLREKNYLSNSLGIPFDPFFLFHSVGFGWNSWISGK